MNRPNFVPAVGRDGKLSLRFLVVLSVIACSLLWQACSAVPQSTAAPAQNPAPPQSAKILLPSASVGSSYREVLTGVVPTELLRLSQGQLPPGLTFNSATAMIAGVPTQAGTFTFTITRMVGQRGKVLATNYALTINPATTATTKAISIQISPASTSVAPGAKLQFTALVKNTSNTAVNWSATGGTISSTGLWTAPVQTSSNNVTITAISAADSSASSSAIATFSLPKFRIVTASLPSGVKSNPYSASLVATGGPTPYRWSVVSGSLPPGLQLNSETGVLSGSPTNSGTYSFVVQGRDAITQKSEQSYSILISNPGTLCGPPTYNCSRTDSAVVQIPAQIPNVGNLTGANRMVTDPDFGSRIVRVTDWNTDPAANSAENRSYVTATSGSADENLWNTDSTMFVLQNMGTSLYPFVFDPASMQASRVYVSSNPTRGGMTISGAGMWSRVSPNILYVADNSVPTISKYDFSDRVNTPTAQLVFDFRSSPNCLPAGFNLTWKTKGEVSSGDTVLAMAYSNTGVQDTGAYAVAYKVGSGCTVLNTQTGQVWGDWGARGTIDIPDRWTIHNAKISKDGNWLVVDPENCLITSCSMGPYFWEIGTTHVTSCQDGLTSGQRCGGHWTEGYTHWINTYDAGLYTTRPFSNPRSFLYLTPNRPVGVQNPLDEHASWNNVDPADSYPFFLSYWSRTTPFPGPWYNEVTAMAPDGSGKVWRFAHSFITAKSQLFSAEYAIGSVSQDGRYFLLSSDWMGTLGSESGTAHCTVGVDCRGDVFVVELK